MEVVEDFESRPHKAVAFLVERSNEIQDWREPEMSGAWPGISGAKLPGRSRAKGGKEEGAEEEEVRKVENQVVSVIWPKEQR